MAKLAVEFFVNYCLTGFVCNSVKISQNLLSEAPVERSILVYFANYDSSSFYGGITRMGPYRTKNDQSGCQRVKKFYVTLTSYQ